MKRIMYFALSFIVIISGIFVVQEKISADDDDSNFTNLIIFMRFAGEDEFIDDVYEGTTVRRITDNSYNTAAYNVSDYYRGVSENKLRMKNVYLFDKGGSIVLSHDRGYYAEWSEDNQIGYTSTGEASSRMYELKLEWADAVEKALAAGNGITNYDGTVKYGFEDLDKNNDGKIDSITIIYRPTTQNNISVTWSSPLWNYRDYANYVTINTDKGSITSGKYFQVTNSYTKPDGTTKGYLFKDSDGNVTVSISVAIHEMGHIMGLKDLYNSSQQSPVYYLSAMAKHLSPVPQLISVKEKEALGWVNDGDVETIIADGQYNIRALGTSGQGAVGYKFDIPEKGKTVYLEYRNFGADGNKYDSKYLKQYNVDDSSVSRITIKSGLVCYLIDSDTKFPNNMNCSASRWNYQVVGGQNSTKNDAALAVDEELELAGGIIITVTAIDGNNLTFTIKGNFAEHVHSGGEATCVKRAICSVCHQEYGEFDPDKHEHTEVRNAKEPSCTEAGYTGDTYCADCDTLLSTGYDIERTAHELQHVEAVEATAAREGNIEYYYCKICDAVFLDEDALQQIEREAVVVAKLAPDMIDGDKSVVDISSGKSAMFRSNAAIDDFIRAELDGKELTVDRDYTVKEGSIIVTLLPAYISRLSTGSHKLGIVSSSGTATANFTVTKSQEPTSSEEETTTKSEPESSQSPTEGTQEPTSSQSPTEGTQEPTSSQSPTGGTQEPTSSQSPTEGTQEPTSSQSPTEGTQEPESSQSPTEGTQEPESSQSPTEGTQEPTSSQSPTGGDEGQTSSQSPTGGAQEPISSQNPTSDGTEPAGTDEPESPSVGGYLSPGTGSSAQVKAWVIVGGLLVSGFAFMRKRK